MVAEKRPALTDDEHAHDVEPDLGVLEVQVFSEVGRREPFECRAVRIRDSSRSSSSMFSRRARYTRMFGTTVIASSCSLAMMKSCLLIPLMPLFEAYNDIRRTHEGD